MIHLDRYKSFKINEAEEVKTEGEVKRSERVLSQAQKEYDGSNIKQTKNAPTILFTDIVGSSKLWSDDPLTMTEQLKKHHILVNNLAEKNGGWIVKTIGDAFMVYFEPTKESLINALRFSRDLVRNETKYNLRIGACFGNVDEQTYKIQKVDLRDFYGNAVNTASRMESKVSDEAGIAFTAVDDISEDMKDKIKKEFTNIESIDLTDMDLRGVKVKKAFKIKLK